MPRRPAAVALMVTLVSAEAWGQCDSPTTLRDLADAEKSFFAAWEQLDVDGVSAAAGQATAALSCLDEPLTPPDVARYFQVVGLAAFVDQQSSRAEQAAQGVKGGRKARRPEPEPARNMQLQAKAQQGRGLY